ncbi:MAG: carbohydrate ABC transporter permease [Thermomicrobiales bacterium]
MAVRKLTTPRVSATPAMRRPATIWQRIWRMRLMYFFLLPAFALLALFEYWPTYLVLKEAFYDWDGFRINNFIGLANFRELLHDPVFLKSARNIVIILVFYLTIPFAMPIIIAETIFNLASERAQKFWRVFLLIPAIVPFLVILLLWQYLYNPVDGFLNIVLQNFGQQPKLWLASPDTSLRSYMAIEFPWASGTYMLIYLAGLQNIPQDVVDASRLDGASTWTRIFRIDMPLIMGQIKLIAILTIIQTLQRYVGILILTNGGPANATIVPGVYLFHEAFASNRLGYASAVGLVLFLFILMLTVINQFLLNSSDTETQERGIL